MRIERVPDASHGNQCEQNSQGKIYIAKHFGCGRRRDRNAPLAKQSGKCILLAENEVGDRAVQHSEHNSDCQPQDVEEHNGGMVARKRNSAQSAETLS